MSSDGLTLPSAPGALADARMSAASRQLSASCGDAAKAHKSAVEFESILLASWLEKMQQTIQTLPDEDQDAGADNFQSMGVQAISGALAARGGLGIAKIIEKFLSPACDGEGNHQSNVPDHQVGPAGVDEKESANLPNHY